MVRGFTGLFVDQFSVQYFGEQDPARKSVATEGFERDHLVRQAVLDVARGRRELCGESGFQTSTGQIYLESHHVTPLCEGGTDKVSNVVALCANHHREAHFGSNRNAIKLKLEAVARTHLRPGSGPDQ